MRVYLKVDGRVIGVAECDARIRKPWHRILDMTGHSYKKQGKSEIFFELTVLLYKDERFPGRSEPFDLVADDGSPILSDCWFTTVVPSPEIPRLLNAEGLAAEAHVDLPTVTYYEV